MNVGKKIKPIYLYIAFAVINIIMIVTMLMITKGQFLSELIWDARNQLFCDFYATMVRVRNGMHPYQANDWDSRYPPLAYLLFSFFSIITPESIPESGISDWDNLYMALSLCLSLVCIVLSVQKMLKSSYTFSLGFIILFVLSAPFSLAEIKAGNPAIYVLALLLVALALKDSDKNIEREFALICIALAAGLKMSPAIMGLLYIKEKRYKEAARLVIYGMIAFFVPFLFFGGIEGLKSFLRITSWVSSAAVPRPESINGVFVELFMIIGAEAEIGLSVGKAVSFLYLSLCVFLFWKRDISWKTMWLLSSLMIVFVNLSYPYTLQYFLIPLIYFVREIDEDFNKRDYLYAALFAMIFFSFPFIRINVATATFITNYFFVYVMMIMLVMDVLYDMLRKRKLERAFQKENLTERA